MTESRGSAEESLSPGSVAWFFHLWSIQRGGFDDCLRIHGLLLTLAAGWLRLSAFLMLDIPVFVN